ncbi:MAG: Trk system potassium transporter TrkA [Lachnospiraceae bacterium]|nr:Trk system potassium transporter TrkA [Lachnospiraceae bacterium]
MKIIIVGAGRTGCSLIGALSKKNYDITVIDRHRDLVESVTDRYSVSGIAGSGASKETLLKAGADTADILIALTPVDEINILSCLRGKALGVVKTVARIFQPDFASEKKALHEEQGIDYIISPKSDMAKEAAENIGFPGIVKPEGLFGEQIRMVSLTVLPDSPLRDKNLIEIRKDIDKEILIATVLRDGKLYVPDGQFRIAEGDIIGIAAEKSRIARSLQRIGVMKHPARKIMITGGGVTAQYLVGMLLEDKKSVTVIESDLERCRELMEKFPSAKISYGDGQMSEILEEEGISSCDALVSLTDRDETNLVTSMYAWSRNVPSILTRIDEPGHLNLLHRVNLDITLSPSEISVNKLIRFVGNAEAGDAPNEIEKYCTVADNMAEVLQFTVGGDFLKPDMPFKDPAFALKKNVIIASVIRDQKVILPDGNSSLKKGDRVIVVSEKKHHIERLNGIFA